MQPPQDTLPGSPPWLAQALHEGLADPLAAVQFLSQLCRLRRWLAGAPLVLVGRVGTDPGGMFVHRCETWPDLAERTSDIARALTEAAPVLRTHAHRARLILERCLEHAPAAQPIPAPHDGAWARLIAEHAGGGAADPRGLFAGLGYCLGAELLAGTIFAQARVVLADRLPLLLPAWDEASSEALASSPAPCAHQMSDVIEMTVDSCPTITPVQASHWIQDGLEQAWGDHALFLSPASIA